MNVVAICYPDGTGEEAPHALAVALGVTAYEARARLRVPQGGPAVVAVLQGNDAAAATAVKLCNAGFRTIVLGAGETRDARALFVARHLVFTGESLRVRNAQGQTLDHPCRDFDLILLGSAISTFTETKVVRERKFSAGRAIVTQGLLITKETKREVRAEGQTRERFVYLYAPNRPTVVLRESALRYDAPGEARQASRAANFSHVVSELRRRSPGAVFDDRLLTRGFQVQMLGPLLTPEEHLDVATALVVRCVRPSS